MKMGLLFRHRSNPSPTEGKTFKGKTPQGGKMDASSENFFMQKMLECVEAQVEVLKKKMKMKKTRLTMDKAS